jgi:hypothetical protein
MHVVGICFCSCGVGKFLNVDTGGRFGLSGGDSLYYKEGQLGS